jgi:hypothetical protein
MINLKLDNETFELRNEANEIDLHELNKIVNIMSFPDLVLTEKFEAIFKVLGLPDNDMDANAMIDLIKNFNVFKAKNIQLQNEIEMKGYKYVAFEGKEFKFKAKELICLEKEIQKNRIKIAQGKETGNLVSYILALIFKREDLTNNEHYENLHLELKAKLFEDHVKADFAIPYINLISKNIFDLV